MNFLITGGLGLIGKSLIKKLLENDHNLVVIDNKPNIKILKDFKYYRIDICKDKIKLKKCITKNNIDVIIHLAAFLGVKSTEQNPEKVIKVNFTGTNNVLAACKGTKVKNFIFSSSSEIYGDPKKKFLENIEPMPKSFYGFSKLQAEIAVKNFCKLNNINYNILRFFNVYGKNQSKSFVIPKFVYLAKRNKNLIIHGKGNQIRSFCYVDDCVKGILKVLKSKKQNMTLNIGNDKNPISILNLAKKIIKMTRSKSKITKIPFEKSDRKKDREIFMRIPVLKKIEYYTNYNPDISLQKGLKFIIK